MLSLRKATTNMKVTHRFSIQRNDLDNQTRTYWRRNLSRKLLVWQRGRNLTGRERTLTEFMFKINKKNKKRKKEIGAKKLKNASLSFEQEQEQQELYDKKNYGKDCSFDTLYLPDMNRQKKIEEITKKFISIIPQILKSINCQQNIRKICYCKGINQLILNLNIVMHKLVQELHKKTAIKEFWNQLEERLLKTLDFPDDLLFVANTMILPHKLSFNNIISSKVKNRYGKPIFQCEQRKAKGQEQEIEVENSTTYRIIEKFRYEKIKHIYPCSKWEIIDINKYDDQHTCMQLYQ